MDHTQLGFTCLMKTPEQKSKLTLKTPDSGIVIIKFKILQLFWYFIVDFDTVLLLVYCITQFDESHIDGF